MWKMLEMEHYAIMKQLSIDEIKMLQVEILSSIDDYCCKNHIEYYLFAGTLLGAVRHKGFIPWDDDIDICMKRDDYDRFFSGFNYGRNDSFEAITVDNKYDYYCAFGKVVDNRTVLTEKNNFNVDIGVYVDVFPLDKVRKGDIRTIINGSILSIYRKILLLKTIKISAERVFWKNVILALGNLVFKPMSTKYVIYKISKYATLDRNKEDYCYLADISVYTYGKKERFYKEYFDNTCLLQFEGKTFKAPCGYDSILKQMYGEYFNLPPISKQQSTHVFEAYWR